MPPHEQNRSRGQTETRALSYGSRMILSNERGNGNEFIIHTGIQNRQKGGRARPRGRGIEGRLKSGRSGDSIDIPAVPREGRRRRLLLPHHVQHSSGLLTTHRNTKRSSSDDQDLGPPPSLPPRPAHAGAAQRQHHHRHQGPRGARRSRREAPRARRPRAARRARARRSSASRVSVDPRSGLESSESGARRSGGRNETSACASR